MFEIRHNGIPRTYRDIKRVAYEAARFAKERWKHDVIEIVDMTTDEKMLMHADGRTS
jgi:hypothetical protein